MKAQETVQESFVPATLISQLENWIDRNTQLPRAPVAAKIELVEMNAGYRLETLQNRPEQTLKALYESGEDRIILIKPWNIHDIHDQSVLLHELVHHRQEYAKHWYCPQSREHPAYLAQEAWLNDQGQTGDFFWLGILLDSSCAKRDIHP